MSEEDLSRMRKLMYALWAVALAAILVAALAA